MAITKSTQVILVCQVILVNLADYFLKLLDFDVNIDYKSFR